MSYPEGMDTAETPQNITDAAQAAANQIWMKYHGFYDGEVQGCCPLIADEIQRTVGGGVIGGYLTWYGGSCQRSHWWVEFQGCNHPFNSHIIGYSPSTKVLSNMRYINSKNNGYPHTRCVTMESSTFVNCCCS